MNPNQLTSSPLKWASFSILFIASLLTLEQHQFLDQSFFLRRFSGSIYPASTLESIDLHSRTLHSIYSLVLNYSIYPTIFSLALERIGFLTFAPFTLVDSIHSPISRSTTAISPSNCFIPSWSAVLFLVIVFYYLLATCDRERNFAQPLRRSALGFV